MNTATPQTDETRFILPENFDAAAVDVLRDSFDNLLDAEVGRVVLDLSLTKFMDSSGIGATVYLFKRLNAQSRDIVLQGVSGQPLDLIQMVKLDRSVAVEAKGAN